MKIHGPSVMTGAGVAAAVTVAVFFFAMPPAQYDYLAGPITGIQDGSNTDGHQKAEQALVMLPALSDGTDDGEDYPGESDPTQSTVTLDTLLGSASVPLGSASAPITLVEFGDYQCHFCSVFFHDTKDRILEGYVTPGKVKMIFKDFHIIGPDSVDASHGAHCAGDQGLFWEYHDILYQNWAGENTGWAAYGNLELFAAAVSDMDVKKWSQCMQDKPHSQKILASNNDARTLGLTGTPSFFVMSPDGRTITIIGAESYEVFASTFDAMLDGMESD